MKTSAFWGVVIGAAALIPAYFLFFTGNPSPFMRGSGEAAQREPGRRPIRHPEPTELQQIGLERVYGGALNEGVESEHILSEMREMEPGSGLWTDKIRVILSGDDKGVYLFYLSDEGNAYRDRISTFVWDYSRVQQHGTEIWLAGGGIASMAQRMPCDVDDDGRPDCYPVALGRFDMLRSSWRDGFFTVYACPHWETEGGPRILSIAPNGEGVSLTIQTECRGVRGPVENLTLPGQGTRSFVIEGTFGSGPRFDVTSVRRVV